MPRSDEPSGHRVRRAGEADAGEIARLWWELQLDHAGRDLRLSFSPDAAYLYRNDLPEFLKADVWRFFVAEKTGRLTGFVSARHWLPEPIYEQHLETYIESLYVQPDVRRKGLGTALVMEVTKWSREVGAARIRLGALAKNEGGLDFWRSVGAIPDIVAMTVELEDSGQ